MYLAIDLGGTKTLVALIDDNGVVQNSTKFATPQEYRPFLDELKSTVDSLTEGQDQIKRACMAIPGSVNRDQGLVVKLGNLKWGENIEIVKDLANLFDFETVIENDANLAGLSEANLVLDKYRKSLYITFSTGIGSVYIIDGKIDDNTIDAEIGHTFYNYEGVLTEWEDMASGKWLYEKYGKKASELEDEDSWRTFSRNMAIGIVNTSLTLTPEVIIIGGGVGTHLDKFKSILIEEIQKLDLGYVKLPEIIKASRAEEAVIYGCYQRIKD